MQAVGRPYPPAQRLDTVDELHGRLIPDPYRWLEDPASPQTIAWSEAQNRLCRGLLDALPGREHLRRRYRELFSVGYVSGPHWLSHPERYFFTRRLGGEEHAKLLVHEPDGGERVLIDPIAIDPSGTTTLDIYSPSWETELLAYQLSKGGDEESNLYVIEVASGRQVEGPIDRCRYSGVSWLPGGEAFYYTRRIHPDRCPNGEEQLHRRVYLHRVGGDPEQDDEVFGDRHGRGWYFSASLSRPDARWLLISASMAGTNRSDLYIADLRANGAVTPVHEGIAAKSYGQVAHDGRLYIHTDLNAPRGRLVVADPTSPQPEHWRDLVPESDAVLGGWDALADVLVVAHQRDAVTTVALHDRETGSFLEQLELPGAGSAAAYGRPQGGHELWFSYTDYATPERVYHHDLRSRETRVWAEPPGWSPQAGMTSRQVFVTSKDGTRIPMFLVHRDGLEPDGGRPLILTGYGGFNASMAPVYSPGYQVWAEAGGVYAIAGLRGGSEYGEEWHRAGRRERKQNVFDDFIACAEWLLATGWTDREHLGISGGSNGGLLVGAALTQRPEQYRAVVCSAPLLDMVRYEHFGLGSTWNDEYGSATAPEELAWLLAYSPYHRVVEGLSYPAVLFTIFASDTRVDPMHGRKMCAALQWATTSDPAERPVLLRTETEVGHGARALSRSIELSMDTASFLANQLRLELPPA
ncbi:MAG TPA: prolyl oligopeptidase family serine peptidase [Candidatus Dormibacteraeota bacterium]|nr:prolyl oligopeptidase family serine peptidase [Candidatus Dormibacteraeota bacterium]